MHLWKKFENEWKTTMLWTYENTSWFKAFESS
jgi:hypothetical protein